MKKALIILWHIFTIIIAVATIGLAVLVIFKPSLLLDAIAYVRWIIDTLGWKNYLLVGWVGFVESIPFLNMAIPWQTFMILIAWFLAQTNIVGTMLVVIIASTLWDAVAYGLWMYKWDSLLRHYGWTFWLTAERIEKLKTMAHSQAHWAVFASKWNSYTRWMLPFIAWTSRMSFWQFMIYNILGSIVYGIIIVFLAKLFIGNYEKVVPYVRWIGVWVFVIVWWWYFIKHYRNERKTR